MTLNTYRWCYARLGVKNSADWTSLKLAYRRRLHACHPDLQRVGDEPAVRDDEFKAVVHAFRMLKRYYELHGQLPDPDTPVSDLSQRTISVRSDSSARVSAYRLDEDRLQPHPRGSSIPRGVSITVAMFVLTVASVAAGNYLAQNSAATATGSVAGHKMVEGQQQLDAGMNPGEVLKIQGVPTLTKGSVWFYGDSGVVFDRGCVSGWENSPPFPLRTKVSDYPVKRQSEPGERAC